MVSQPCILCQSCKVNKGDFVKQATHVSEKKNRLAFLKNRFHNSECTQRGMETHQMMRSDSRRNAQFTMTCRKFFKAYPYLCITPFLTFQSKEISLQGLLREARVM